MGTKGDKFSQDASLTAELLVSKLESVGGITSKKMFGGFGIFCDGKMFGLVNSKGIAYLKADETSKHNFENAGSVKHSRMPYFSIPESVLENQEQIIIWAKSSIALTK